MVFQFSKFFMIFFFQIFHLNGCGPTPAQCGNTPDPSWKTYDIRNKSQFLHMDIEVNYGKFWNFYDQDSLFRINLNVCL